MKNVRIYIKKYWVLWLAFMVIIVPIFINVLFKVPAMSTFLSYEAEAGDIINYYASILSALGTVFLGYVAYKQNERLVRVEEVSKMAYVKLDEQSDFTLDRWFIMFEEITNIPIIDWSISASDYKNEKVNRKYEEYHWITLEKNKYIQPAVDCNNNEICIDVDNTVGDCEEYIMMLQVNLTSIFGYTTEQLFNIVIYKGVIEEVAIFIKK